MTMEESQQNSEGRLKPKENGVLRTVNRMVREGKLSQTAHSELEAILRKQMPHFEKTSTQERHEIRRIAHERGLDLPYQAPNLQDESIFPAYLRSDGKRHLGKKIKPES